MAVSDKEFEDLKKEVIELRKRLKEKEGDGISKAEKSFEKIEKATNLLINTFKNLSSWIGSAWGDADDVASKYAKTIGISAKGMETLRKNTINFVADNSIGAKFNTSMKELVDLQISYNKQIGRSIQMTNEQLANLAAMKSILGDEQTIKFTANFERFGLDANAAANTFAEMFSNASKKGISLERYSKNFLDNIDLAQKYTFQNGIEGLRRMAEKASAIKLDLQQTASFAEKVNTVEGSIKTGAKLSVLGGPFAQLSNPMGMLYESLNDLEGLQDRMAKMTSGFAKWNSETNQVEVSAFNRLRLKAMAEATGQDFGKLMDSVYAQGRRKQVEKQFNDRGLSDEIKELVLNTAQIDRKTGQAYVTIKGERRDINSVTNQDLKALQSINKTQAEDVKDIAIMLRSYTDIQSGLTKQYTSLKAQIQDNNGWGKASKSILSVFSDTNWILKSILATTTAIALTRGAGQWFGAGGVFPINSIMRTKTNSNAKPLNTSSSSIAPTINTTVNTANGNISTIGSSTIGGSTTIGSGGGTVVGNTSNNSSMNPMKNKKTTPPIKHSTPYKKWGSNTYASQTANSIKAGMDPYARFAHDAKINSLNFKSGFGFSPMGGMIGGIIGSGASMALHNIAGNKTNTGSRALRIGADIAQYAGMGAMFGPWGALAGAIIGGTIGGIREGRENAKRNRLKQLEQKGIYLSGDYTPEQLKKILGGIGTIGINSKLYNKLKANGDLEAVGFGTSKMANGGLIIGKSHAQGGVSVKNSNIELEGGEFIVNKDATAKHFGELNAINQNNIKPIEPMGKIMKVNEVETTISNINVAPTNITFEPISLNVGGSIKLDLGNKQVDIEGKDLLNNPEFIRSITNIITKQLNLIENKRFKKDSYFRKM